VAIIVAAAPAHATIQKTGYKACSIGEVVVLQAHGDGDIRFYTGGTLRDTRYNVPLSYWTYRRRRGVGQPHRTRPRQDHHHDPTRGRLLGADRRPGPLGIRHPADLDDACRVPDARVPMVSNQSYLDDPVVLTVVIDGVDVLSQPFEVRNQHHFVRFPLRLGSGHTPVEGFV